MTEWFARRFQTKQFVKQHAVKIKAPGLRTLTPWSYSEVQTVQETVMEV